MTIEAGRIEIRSLDAAEPFSMDAQVTEDSIDLRLAPSALRLRDGFEYVDYIEHDLAQTYEEIEIPAAGLDLRPLEPILTQTPEAVCMPEDLMGLVFAQSFARMGILTNCMAPKFAIGIRWAFPLLLVNLTRTPIRIYQYAPIMQLLVSDVRGEPVRTAASFRIRIRLRRHELVTANDGL